MFPDDGRPRVGLEADAKLERIVLFHQDPLVRFRGQPVTPQSTGTFARMRSLAARGVWGAEGSGFGELFRQERPPRSRGQLLSTTAARQRYRSHMSNQTRQVLEQALRLPQRERATLVAELLRTLDDEGDEGLTQEEWEKAWAAEIDRRVREIREGKAELIDGDQALRRVRAGLRPNRRK